MAGFVGQQWRWTFWRFLCIKQGEIVGCVGCELRYNSYPNAILCAGPRASSEVKSSSLFLISLIVTGIRDGIAGGYCVQLLKFAAMVSVEVYEERFSRLKEVDPGKDKVIEVSCLDDYSLVRRILIELFIYRT